MKAKITLLFSLLMFSGILTFAQQQRQSVEERVKGVMEKMTPLKLDEDQTKKTDSVFTQFYQAQTKMMEEMRAAGGGGGGGFDRSGFEKLTTERNSKLKAIFSADQYKKFTKEIEETLTPQRRGRS